MMMKMGWISPPMGPSMSRQMMSRMLMTSRLTHM
jgi:hypothetical protein